MVSKEIMTWGAVLVAILIALTEYMGNWSGDLNYLWAVLVLLWGIFHSQD